MAATMTVSIAVGEEIPNVHSVVLQHMGQTMTATVTAAGMPISLDAAGQPTGSDVLVLVDYSGVVHSHIVHGDANGDLAMSFRVTKGSALPIELPGRFDRTETVSIWPTFTVSIDPRDGSTPPDPVVIAASSPHDLRYFGAAATNGAYPTLAYDTDAVLGDAIRLIENVAYSRPAVVQSAQASTNASTTHSTPWDVAPTAGNWLMAVFAWDDATKNVATHPAGWHQLLVLDGTVSPNCATYYYENCGAAQATPIITLTGAANIIGAVMEVSGIATASSEDTGSTVSNNTPIPSTIISDASVLPLLTTVPVELWVGIAVSASGGRLSGQDHGFTLHEMVTLAPGTLSLAGTALSLALCTKVATSVGGVKMSMTAASATVSAMILSAFKAAAITLPTPAANTLLLYAKDSGGVSKLFYKGDNGVEVGPLT